MIISILLLPIPRREELEVVEGNVLVADVGQAEGVSAVAMSV